MNMLLLKILLLFALSVNSFAAFVYITDEVDIPIRSAKSFEDNIIRSAPSGTKLKILQTDADGWTKIKLERTIGWVISRYLTNNPPARIELEKLRKTANANALLVTKQKNNIKKLEQELQEIKKSNKDNRISALKAQAEKRHIENTYAEALKIEHENTRLKQHNLNLQSEIKLLQTGNTTTIENSNRLWFLYGGIVMILGVIIGFLVSMKRRR
jgi:SH3 domain protein